MSRWTSMVVWVAAIVTAAGAQDVAYDYEGDGVAASLGWAVVSLGDVNGDGVRDFALSAPYAMDSRGVVQVHSGATGEELWRVVGPEFNQFPKQFGYELEAVGDVNLDGVEDVLVGLPGYKGNKVFVFSGGNGRKIHRIGDSTAAAFGTAAAGLGDVNGDGHADFAVSAPGTNDGLVRVFSGQDATMLYQLDGGRGNFGVDLASIGDVDGDGIRELAVSEVPEAGPPSAVRVFSGANGAAMYVLHGIDPGDRFGTSIDSIGDWDGDGDEDLVVGALESVTDPVGYVQVRSGVDGAVLATLHGKRAGQSFGAVVSEAGDVNADGRPDLLVTSRNAPNQLPTVQLISGASQSVLYRFDAAKDYDELGHALAGLGDLDGDGLGEIAIGAPGAENGAGRRGRGRLRVHNGNDLYLFASKRSVVAGDTLKLRTSEGAAGSPVLVAITEVDGVPEFQVIARGDLNAEGALTIRGAVPPNLGSVLLGLRSLTVSPAGRVLDSADELVQFE